MTIKAAGKGRSPTYSCMLIISASGEKLKPIAVLKSAAKKPDQGKIKKYRDTLKNQFP